MTSRTTRAALAQLRRSQVPTLRPPSDSERARLELVRRFVVHDRDVHAEIAMIRERDGLSQAAIARESGVGETALNRWLNGDYEGDQELLEAKLARWIDSYNVRELEGRLLPKAPSWVETPSARRVIKGLAYAQLAGDIAIIYGAAGVGKTTAAHQHAAVSPNVWIATMSTATASVVNALEEIVSAIGVREAGGAAKLHRAIVRRVTGTHGLLVIDEAQHLVESALDALRAIHDAAGIGIAFMGNELVYARFTGGARAAYLDRLHSRIGKRVKLTRTLEGDTSSLLNAWAIREPDARRLLAEIARRPGGLRTVTKVLRLASVVAARHGGVPSAADIRTAYEDLSGSVDGGES